MSISFPLVGIVQIPISYLISLGPEHIWMHGLRVEGFAKHTYICIRLITLDNPWISPNLSNPPRVEKHLLSALLPNDLRFQQSFFGLGVLVVDAHSGLVPFFRTSL